MKTRRRGEARLEMVTPDLGFSSSYYFYFSAALSRIRLFNVSAAVQKMLLSILDKKL